MGRHERQGRYVHYLEDADPREVLLRYEEREAIKSQAARLAARNMDHQQIERLRELVRRAEACSQMADIDGRGQAKNAFLDFILENCGNPLLYRTWRGHRLFPYLVRSQQFEDQIMSKVGPRPKLTGNERLVTEAIAPGRPGRSRTSFQARRSSDGRGSAPVHR